MTDALSSLQRSLQIAEEKDDHEAICEACCKLGVSVVKEALVWPLVHLLRRWCSAICSPCYIHYTLEWCCIAC